MRTRLIIGAIVAAIVGVLVYHFFWTIVLAFSGFHIWRLFLRKHGYGKARRTVKAGGIPAWIEAASLARIALSFGGVTTKKEVVNLKPQPVYRKRGQTAKDDPLWDDPDWPYRA
jgi:hypothetical protein